jgi:hypothetical protein
VGVSGRLGRSLDGRRRDRTATGCALSGGKPNQEGRPGSVGPFSDDSIETAITRAEGAYSMTLNQSRMRHLGQRWRLGEAKVSWKSSGGAAESSTTDIRRRQKRARENRNRFSSPSREARWVSASTSRAARRTPGLLRPSKPPGLNSRVLTSEQAARTATARGREATSEVFDPGVVRERRQGSHAAKSCEGS